MYHEGKGVLVDLTKAVYWYEQAALQGYSNAQYQLGESFHSRLVNTNDG